jgi:hypothetical protein
VREKREEIQMTNFFRETVEYYRERLARFNIEVQLKVQWIGIHRLMNKGKLVQIIDNLSLNSECWLREEICGKHIKTGIITVEVSKPFIRISDITHRRAISLIL